MTSASERYRRRNRRVGTDISVGVGAGLDTGLQEAPPPGRRGKRCRFIATWGRFIAFEGFAPSRPVRRVAVETQDGYSLASRKQEKTGKL